MKRNLQMVLVSFLFTGAAVAAPNESPYPSDAEASYSLPALDSYAAQMTRKGMGSDQSEQWGVGRRQAPKPHDPYPFGGGPVDD